MRKLHFFNSIKFKFSALYLLLIVTVIVLMNTYFLTEARDMVFSSKQTLMQSQTLAVSSSLSSLERLSPDDVNQAMGLMDSTAFSRIIVVTSSGLTLYDTSDDDAAESIFEAYLPRSLEGYDVFYSSFSNGTFLTGAFSPIVTRGVITGSVFAFEKDAEQGFLLLSMQSRIRVISLLIAVISVAFMLALIGTAVSRISKLYNAISTVREGDYEYRVKVAGSDELALLSEEFNTLTDRLQETEEIRKRFVADASHELKTPLASIRLLSDSILQNETIEMDTVQEFVNDIGNEAARLARTTEKLLTLTKLDSSISEETGPVDLSKVISDTLHSLLPLAESKPVTLDSRLDTGCIVFANEDNVHEIIYNLVENAIKYNVPNGSVFVELTKFGQGINVDVDDTGIGIPQEDIDHIFERFYRVDKARSRELGGSGLGLSIVKDLVEHHGGEISASRRYPCGMRFHITFPTYIPDESNA